MRELLEKALKAFNASSDYVQKILNELELIGVTELRSEGPVQLYTGVNVVGKGQNSVVVRGVLLGMYDCVCKILRPDASRQDLLHEARALICANSVGVGPRLYTFTRHVLVMEYVRGQTLDEWVKANPQDSDIKKLVQNLLEQCFRLDQVGLVHDELSRPREHVIVREDLTPCIIDFETSSFETSGKRTNLTQILNALVLGGSETAQIIRSRLGLTEEKMRQLRQLLSMYKQERTQDLFREILRIVIG